MRRLAGGKALSLGLCWVLVVVFKRRWGGGYDRAVEASSEEILAELHREYPACRRTTCTLFE